MFTLPRGPATSVDAPDKVPDLTCGNTRSKAGTKRGSDIEVGKQALEVDICTS